MKSLYLLFALLAHWNPFFTVCLSVFLSGPRRVYIHVANSFVMFVCLNVYKLANRDDFVDILMNRSVD